MTNMKSDKKADWTMAIGVAILLLLAGLTVKAEAAKPSAEKVKKETVEAVEAAGAYAGEKREEFAKRMKTNIEEVNREIEALKHDTKTASKEAKAAAEARITKLEKQRDDLVKKYETFEKSTDKAWTKMKSGLEKAWGEVKSAYTDAKSELKSATK